MIRSRLVFLLLACASAAPAPAPAPTLGAALDERALERDVTRLVNRHRATRHLKALAYDTAVASVARAHSVAMARGRVPLGHDGFSARADQVQRFLELSEIAENVALNDYPRARTVNVAIDGWLRSPHHRENIEGAFDVTGVGIARSSNGTYYYTQMFVARRR